MNMAGSLLLTERATAPSLLHMEDNYVMVGIMEIMTDSMKYSG
jgi:hypothetical protein